MGAYVKLSGLVKSVVVYVCVAKEVFAMTILEDLYYGNISSHERYIKREIRVDKLVKLIKNEEELNSTLTEKQKETFEKFKGTSELSCITERETFSSGFTLATRIMVEVMEGLEENHNPSSLLWVAYRYGRMRWQQRDAYRRKSTDNGIGNGNNRSTNRNDTVHNGGRAD